MSSLTATAPAARARSSSSRIHDLFAENLAVVHRRCDRMFCWLMATQWAVAIGIALLVSPQTWEGRTPSIHVHVWLAILTGGALTLPMLVMARHRPGAAITRHVAAVSQMLWSALLVHLTGGRIETHFHVFGSLAFLAFYRDWRVMATATMVVCIEHLVRGAMWPEAVYGIPNPEWWRFLEHAAWVIFEDTVLLMGIHQGRRELRAVAERQESFESLQVSLEERVAARTIELDTSREQFRSLVESVHAVPWEMSVDTSVLTYVGPQGAKLLGCKPEDWRAADFWKQRVHEADFAATMAAFRKCAVDTGNVDCEFRMRRDDGAWLWVRCVCSRALDRLQPTLRGLMFDITERHRLESELGQAQKLESVGRLAAGVAHEINTPTQFVGDNIRFLRDAFADLDRLIAVSKAIGDSADEAQRAAAVGALTDLRGSVDFEYLRSECPLAISQSLDGVDRVAKIVHAMKDFAHADQSEKAVVDVNRVISGAVTVCRNEWKYVAELHLQLDESAPTVQGFAQDLGQVILNLVVNAAHAIAEKTGGKEKGAISVCSRASANAVEIEVTDSGSGIPEAIRPRVFEQFFTTKPVGKGTGQGLALAHRIIVQKHGGALTFDSRVGHGTTFRIVLPQG